MMGKEVIVIGAGFAGLAAATSLADAGYQVTVLEKNATPGGRARMFEADGFRFDMGPSWYWMPDVFDAYFAAFGKKTADYYELRRLDPSYSVVFGPGEAVDMPAGRGPLKALFESIDPGAGRQLQAFLDQAAYKYRVAMQDFVWKPGRSVTEFMNARLLADVLRMDVLKSFHRHVRRFFSHEKLLQLVEFPVLFLGAIPQNTPALYSLMNYAEMELGTWYPMGGMFEIVRALVALAEEKGVRFRFSEEVTRLHAQNGRVTAVETPQARYTPDVVVAGADYHHVEQLLPEKARNYREAYWQKRVMAPSALLYYVGVDRRVGRLGHHTLFFDEDFTPHAHRIYTEPGWPERPLFYVCAPSKTDPTVAPAGHENLFLLVPVAPGLPDDTEAVRAHYYDLIMTRLERHVGHAIRPHVVYQRSYAHRDFVADYHAFRGNAYGLANTLMQTALLKPSLKNRHLSNLYYTGQLTVPGPGVPPALISGQVVAREIQREHHA